MPNKAILKKCSDPECQEFGVAVNCGSLFMKNGSLFFLCSVKDDWTDTIVPVAVIDDDTLGFILPPHDEISAEYVEIHMDDEVECQECGQKGKLRDFVELV